MKSAKQVEQSIRRLHVEAGVCARERTLHDLAEAHTQQKQKRQAFGLLSLGRNIMRQRPRRIAAVATLVVVLVGAFSLSTGSVAFSQVGHAASSTLSWLKSMLAGSASEGPTVPLPEPAGEWTSSPDRRAIVCTGRFFDVPEDEQGLWQSLKDLGIEFVEASTEPFVSYAILNREQAESFSVSVSLRCTAAPRVTVLEGETAGMAISNDQHSGGLALGWLPTVSNDGKEIVLRISFHDGETGFELLPLGTEPGGTLLILARGVFQDPDDHSGQDNVNARRTLVQVQVDVQQ